MNDEPLLPRLTRSQRLGCALFLAAACAPLAVGAAIAVRGMFAGWADFREVSGLPLFSLGVGFPVALVPVFAAALPFDYPPDELMVAAIGGLAGGLAFRAVMGRDYRDEAAAP